MASTVGANGLTVVHKDSKGTVSFTPDVCLTPQPSGPPVPIPYSNTALAQDADLGALTVTVEGNPVLVQRSIFMQSSGDEAGVIGGVTSGVTKGLAEFAGYSFDVIVEGKGVARQGDLMIGNKGASSNTPSAPEQQPPFPGAVSVAPEDEEEEVTDEKLASTVAFDELKALAEDMEETELLVWLTALFGADIPEAGYRSFRGALLDGSLPQPEVKLLRGGLGGHLGGYDRDRRAILVSVALVHRAREDAGEAWALFAVLLEEFGHHVDHLLRNQYSTAGGDARLDEGTRVAYALANLGWDERDRFAFATHETDDGRADIEVEFAGLHQAVERFMNREEEEDDATSGSVEYFGAGRGSGRPWSYGHESIEDRLGEAGFGTLERRRIYFGNWLRDYSQVVDPMIVRARGETGASFKPSRAALTKIVDVLARQHFGDEPAFRVALQPWPDDAASQQRLGVYRPDEHIDNPCGITDKRSVDPDFRGPCLPSELTVNPATLMKRYMRSSAPVGARDAQRHRVRDGETLESIARANGMTWQELAVHNFGTALPERVNEHLRAKVGCTRRTADGHNYVFTSKDEPGILEIPGAPGRLGPEEHGTALGHIQRRIGDAIAQGKTDEGHRLLGAALHTLEDYYAHTNFVEVALNHLGHAVEAWVPMPRTGAKVDARSLPITSGMFGGLDTAASLLAALGESLQKAEQCTVGEPTSGTVITLILLQDLGWTRTRAFLGGMSETISELEKKVPWLATLGCRTIGAVVGVIHYMLGGVIRGAASQIDDAQSAFLVDPTSTNPSHSQLAKDHDDHPLHALASQLAAGASRDVGRAIQQAWGRPERAGDVVRVAAKYLVHPAHIAPGSGAAWVLDRVRAWTELPTSPAALRRLSSRTWMTDWSQERQKELGQLRRRAERLYRENEDVAKRLQELLGGKKP